MYNSKIEKKKDKKKDDLLVQNMFYSGKSQVNRKTNARIFSIKGAFTYDVRYLGR